MQHIQESYLKQHLGQIRFFTKTVLLSVSVFILGKFTNKSARSSMALGGPCILVCCKPREGYFPLDLILIFFHSYLCIISLSLSLSFSLLSLSPFFIYLPINISFSLHICICIHTCMNTYISIDPFIHHLNIYIYTNNNLSS